MNWMIEPLTSSLLHGAAIATVLSVMVWLAGRFPGHQVRPEWMHLLWLLVLGKMVTPPVVPWRVLPGLKTISGEVVSQVGSPLAAGPAEMAGSVASAWLSTSVLVFVAILLGSIVLGSVLITRVARFHAFVQAGRRPRRELAERAAQIGARLGLKAVPDIVLVTGRVSPMLWPGLRRCRLVLPEELLPGLTGRELDGLLAHELGHFKRKDHLVRYLETAVTILFWWNPVTWWVRRSLRVAEERSCDRLVVRAFPGLTRSYADGLIKTVEFIGEPGPGSLMIATGAGEARNLKERIRMIMKKSSPGPVGPGQKLTLALVALAVLAIFPTWAVQDAVPTPTPPESAEAPVVAEEVIARLNEELQRRDRKIAELMARLEARSRKLHDARLEHSYLAVEKQRAEALALQADQLEVLKYQVKVKAVEKQRAEALALQADQLEVLKYQVRVTELQRMSQDRAASLQDLAEARRKELEIQQLQVREEALKQRKMFLEQHRDERIQALEKEIQELRKTRDMEKVRKVREDETVL